MPMLADWPWTDSMRDTCCSVESRRPCRSNICMQAGRGRRQGFRRDDPSPNHPPPTHTHLDRHGFDELGECHHSLVQCEPRARFGLLPLQHLLRLTRDDVAQLLRGGGGGGERASASSRCNICSACRVMTSRSSYGEVEGGR